MKRVATEIKNIIASDNFQNLDKLKGTADKYGWLNREYYEMDMNEAIFRLGEILSIFENLFEKNTFNETILYNDRNNLLSSFQQLSSKISDMLMGIDGVSSFIQQVQNIQQISNKYKLELSIEGYPTYEKKKNEIYYLIRRYKDLIKILETAEQYNNESQEILNNLNNINQKSENSFQEIQNQRNSIVSIKNDIDGLYEGTKLSNKNISDYESEIKTKKETIVEFFNEIEGYRKDINQGLGNISKTINTNEDRLNKYISEKTKLMNNIIETNNGETNKIIEKNNKLQEDIRGILGKAVSTNLYKSFNVKGNRLLLQMIFWFICLLLSIGLVILLGESVLDYLQPFFSTGKMDNLSITFFLRLSLLFPAIYALYFTSSQFNNTVKLKEEYNFKSAVAVALQYFKELVENSEEGEDKRFLVDSITKIFESPTENVFGKRISEKDIWGKTKDVMNTTANFIGKVNGK